MSKKGSKVGLINWHEIKDSQSLITSLESFIERTFDDKLKDEVMKIQRWSSKSKPRDFEYLRQINVHRAARWYIILQKLKERNYSFDLKLSLEVEEFQRLLLFAYTFDTLIQSNVIQSNDKRIKGALLDPERFETFTYEILVTANYLSQGFEVQLPELLGAERTDIYARKGEVEVYAECKRLRRSEQCVSLAIKIMQELCKYEFNGIVDITLKRAPRKSREIEETAEHVRSAVIRKREIVSEENITIRIQRLPETIENMFEIHLPQPNDIEFVVSSSNVGVFNDVLKVKNPKILVLRDPNRLDRLKKQLLKWRNLT